MNCFIRRLGTTLSVPGLALTAGTADASNDQVTGWIAIPELRTVTVGETSSRLAVNPGGSTTLWL